MTANISITVPAPGTIMQDGTIYAGVSPDTGRPIYTTPKDAPLLCLFNEAGNYPSKLEAHGCQDWRVPTKAELKVLFRNRAAIGGFNTSGSHPAGSYWSSSRLGDGLAWTQRFSDGFHGYNVFKGFQSALRCVRG